VTQGPGPRASDFDFKVEIFTKILIPVDELPGNI
jgi:hypothetical protein